MQPVTVAWVCETEISALAAGYEAREKHEVAHPRPLQQPHRMTTNQRCWCWMTTASARRRGGVSPEQCIAPSSLGHISTTYVHPLLDAPWHAEPLFILVTIVTVQEHVKEKMKDI